MINIKEGLETKNLVDIESIFNKVLILDYNDDFIEVPGIVLIYKKSSASFFGRILNPGVEIIQLEDAEFDSAIEKITILSQNSNIISCDQRTKPTRYSMINLDKLKEQGIIFRTTDDSIYVNNYVFTNNELEFHGIGMFTSKKVIFLTFDQLNKVKEAIS
jgi:hypothetical protein